jgi:hypothetical protein
MTKPFSAREQLRPAPPWVRYLSSLLAAVLIWPLTRLTPRGWAHFVSRGMTRMLGKFHEPYEPTPHDVFICSYFKSGTNWTMQIAVQVAHRGAAAYDHIHDVVSWPDMAPRARFAVPLHDDRPRAAALTGLRVIKTHLPLDRVPYSPAARYVCVVRDPKDVFVSSYHFTRSHVGFLMPAPAAWLDAYLSPDTALGSWAAHLTSYWRARDRKNVLFLTYEQMRRDLEGTVQAIAGFMGVELTADETAAVVRQSTFAHMKSIEDKFATRGAPWTTVSGAMIRSGKHGASGELLSAGDQVRVDDYWRAELARLECDFPYDAAFGVARVADAVPVPVPAAAR